MSVAFEPVSIGRKTAQLTITAGPVVFTIDLVGTALEFQRVGVFAFFASGGGWKTTLTLENGSSFATKAHITFHPDAGSFAPVLPGTIAGQVDVTINPGGSYMFDAELTSAAVTTGWLDITAGGPLTGYEIFRWHSSGNPDMETTVMMDTDTSSTANVLIPFDETAGFHTAIATISVGPGNPNGGYFGTIATDADGHLIAQNLYGSGGPSGRAYFAADLANLFSDHGDFSSIRGRRGFIELAAGTSAIALRFNSSGSFTSLPIARSNHQP